GLCEERVTAVGGNPSDFDKLYSSSEFGGLKPCEKAFGMMISENGFSAGEILLVGDSEECDEECAKRSGAKFFPVKTDEDMVKLFREITGKE
ncbi:MAG: HAD hydrolase-like protein, partial [Oscillospiraceae bacterium]|nr:HAD hydrolase-like protein [Oscillospiraceae bacterium]